MSLREDADGRRGCIIIIGERHRYAARSQKVGMKEISAEDERREERYKGRQQRTRRRDQVKPTGRHRDQRYSAEVAVAPGEKQPSKAALL